MSLRRGLAGRPRIFAKSRTGVFRRVAEVSVLDAGQIVRDRLSAAIERRDYALTSSGSLASTGLMTSSGFLTSSGLPTRFRASK
jgi:hypothetical protein